MGILEAIFGKPRKKMLDSWRESQIETNRRIRFYPEPGLTKEEETMAQSVIEMFTKMFAPQVFCEIKPSSTYDYKIFMSKDGEVVYGHDLGDIEGPFMIQLEQLQQAIERNIAQHYYEKHTTGIPNYQYRIFVFRKDKENVVYYADNNGVIDFISSGLSI